MQTISLSPRLLPRRVRSDVFNSRHAVAKLSMVQGAVLGTLQGCMTRACCLFCNAVQYPRADARSNAAVAVPGHHVAHRSAG
jgi:hypothetical protein